MATIDRNQLRTGGRAPRVGAVVLALVLTCAGCGSSASVTTTSDSGSTSRPATTASDPRPQTTTSTTSTTATPGTDSTVATTRAGRASALRFAVLRTTFAPVSRGLYQVVTADSLRRDAESSGADSATMRARVTVEQQRVAAYSVVLTTARRQLLAARALTVQERAVQRLLVSAVDSRRVGLAALRVVLAQRLAAGRDAEVTERERVWRAAWNSSYRSTRAATNLEQAELAQLHAAPAPEEAFR